MVERSTCPICAKRKSERFCLAKGEKICAVCCGTEREITLDCPSECSYLIAAHRYEQDHSKPREAAPALFPDVLFSMDAVYERQPLANGLGLAIVKFAAGDRSVTDNHVLTALTALAETYRTLVSGIYYEKPPSAPPASDIYLALGTFIQEYRKQETEGGAPRPLRDTEILHVLVFLARVTQSRMSQRPRAKVFLEFLRAQFPPASELEPQAASRIIIP